MHLHFVGVSGTGMGALAGLMKELGHEVSGSDTAFYPPIGPALEKWGVRLMTGFDPTHLDPRPDLVVIGNVCRPQNPEARAAIDGGLRYSSMVQALAEFVLADAAPLVVGGTHGKTTTSAMCAHILAESGFSPGFLIGGIPKNFDSSFHPPAKLRRALPVAGSEAPKRKPPFVVEGDEYDTAFFEKTPKFWHYRAEVGIITSIEHDHIDIYPDPASYERAFAGFVERLPASGLLVGWAGDPKIVALAAEAKCDVAYYGLDGDSGAGPAAHYLAYPAETTADGQTLDLFVGGVAAGRLALAVPGAHNARNALGALAACCQGYGVSVRQAMDALATFQGVKRRQDLIFTAAGVAVYDDFAHHPTAVRETLAALRAKHPKGKLFAVFEPRSATACRSLHQAEYEDCWSSASEVIFSPLGRTDIPEAERLDLDRIVAALKKKGGSASRAGSIEEIVERLRTESSSGDTIALLSNGAFGGIYEKLRVALESR